MNCVKCNLYPPIKYRKVCTKCRSLYHKDLRIKNAERYTTYNRQYQVNRSKIDPAYKISRNLRKRLNNAIKDSQKAGSAIKDLGCSIQQLKTYLESKFLPGMTWENHGEWHIDHIKPLISFDLSIPEEVKLACHYNNLQPLWAVDNLSKHDKQ